MVLWLGSSNCLSFLFNSAPQFIQLLFNPNEITPHFSHLFNCDLNELKLINAISINNKGISKINSRILPIMFIRKLKPKQAVKTAKIKM